MPCNAALCDLSRMDVPRIKLHLSERQSQAWHLLEDTTTAMVFAGGGAGGGKSWLGCLWQIHRRLTYPGTRGFIGRETAASLRDSTMKTYFALLSMLGYGPDHYSYNSTSGVLTFATGSEQHFRWLAHQPSDPNYDRLGSTEYTDAFVDEGPEVSERACEVLLSRLRYMHTQYDLRPSLLITGNPGNSWVKRKFVMDARGNMLDLPPHLGRVLFTVRDNMDAAFAERYARTLELMSPYDRARLLHGDWNATPVVENPFAFAYNRERHVCATTSRPQDIHYFSLDFNVEPFSAIVGHIWQDGEGHHVHIISEAVVEASVEAMARWIMERCPHRHLIRITGDRGGMSRGIGTRGPVRIFEELRKVLQLSQAQLDVPANPSHLQSREDTNFVLANHPDLRIVPRCVQLTSDLAQVAVDGNGGIIKHDRSRPDQRADHLDSFRYFVNTYLRRWIKQNRADVLHLNHGLQADKPMSDLVARGTVERALHLAR